MLKRVFSVFVVVAMMFVSMMVVSATDNDLELLPDKKYNLGDVNTDERLTIGDVTLIQEHLAMITEFNSHQLKLADANSDQKVNINDATYIQMILAGIIVPEKPTEPTTDNDDKPIELPFVPAV